MSASKRGDCFRAFHRVISPKGFSDHTTREQGGTRFIYAGISKLAEANRMAPNILDGRLGVCIEVSFVVLQRPPTDCPPSAIALARFHNAAVTPI